MMDESGFLTPSRKEMMKEVGIVALVAVPVLIELSYQIYKYWKKRSEEDED